MSSYSRYLLKSHTFFLNFHGIVYYVNCSMDLSIEYNDSDGAVSPTNFFVCKLPHYFVIPLCFFSVFFFMDEYQWLHKPINRLPEIIFNSNNNNSQKNVWYLGLLEWSFYCRPNFFFYLFSRDTIFYYRSSFAQHLGFSCHIHTAQS